MVRLVLFLFLIGKCLSIRFPCPPGPGPREALRFIPRNDSCSLNLTLLITLCMTPEGGKGFVIRAVDFKVNGYSAILSDFAIYDSQVYDRYPHLCFVNLNYLPDSSRGAFLLAESFYAQSNSSHYFCGPGFYDCRAGTWRCALPRFEYEDYFSKLFTEMLTPKEYLSSGCRGGGGLWLPFIFGSLLNLYYTIN